MANQTRTQVDWSTHTHRREVFKNQQGQEIIVDHLQKGKSPDEYICFINDFRGLTVRGDYSDWVFCRNFIPHPDNKTITEHYWIEKLQIANTSMEFKSLDFEATQKALEKEFEWVDKGEYTQEEWEKIEEWKEEIIGTLESGDEVEYLYMAYRLSNPLDWDGEYFPYYKKVPIHLEVVFDAFEEICRRFVGG